MATITPTAPSRGRASPGFDGGLPPGGGSQSALGNFEMRVRRARLGMLVALIGIVMIFISFSSAYVVRKGLPSFDARTNSLTNDWLRVRLPALLLINTGVLLLSSLTMELARRQAARDVVLAGVTSIRGASVTDKNRISWLAITVVLGLSFLAGQLMVWRELAAMGFYVATSPSSSFVYLLTGVHGVHLLGGVLALLFAGAASLLRRPTESQYVTLDVTGWYWHFMAVLWVYIFCLLEFVH
jgi:cytochrome c oxidase subunit III